MTTHPTLGFCLVGGAFSVLALGLWVSCEVLVLSMLWCVWSILALGLEWLSCMLLLLLMLSSQLWLMYLFWALLMAQLGYLHLTNASVRCCNVFWKNSGPVQTVLAKWVSVPMTLYLADRLWWLSHCKYWSVCVELAVHSYGKGIICLRCNKGIKEGNGPISLITFNSKPACWIYAIDMVQECLFMGLLLNDKSVIHKP